ncbi:hypothetical protein EKO23_19870 [Nocardioides guangzhouensis]|uniref:Uncharacterized protein n=1 Tax=Nocardioides guangzhouensis TaxID=2497878 RepID=A0A4Q4Z5X3_9ACTN|nr:hypothetical protein [Nocardioides guangzhouensis]RYP83190.1 hypothetical protein EKO23_19870 [Nocardioides guangzhouensis]
MTMVDRTALARTPWPVAATGLASSVLVLAIAARWPTSAALPFVGRMAELALAGCAAYLLDDAAAPLTGVAPQGPWRRRAPVLLTGVVLIALAWLGLLAILGWRDVRPPVPEASAELVVAGLVAVALATSLMRLGDPEPGVVVAPVVALSGVGLLVIEGLVRSPVFLTSTDPTAGLVTGWVAVGSAAGAVVLLTPPGAPSRRPVPDVTPWRKRRSGVG